MFLCHGIIIIIQFIISIHNFGISSHFWHGLSNGLLWSETYEKNNKNAIETLIWHFQAPSPRAPKSGCINWWLWLKYRSQSRFSPFVTINLDRTWGHSSVFPAHFRSWAAAASELPCTSYHWGFNWRFKFGDQVSWLPRWFMYRFCETNFALRFPSLINWSCLSSAGFVCGSNLSQHLH